MHIALAGLRQAQLPGRAMEQRRADPRLELRDALGHDRGRDIELARGGRESGRIRGGEEGLKVYQDVHVDLSRFEKADRVFWWIVARPALIHSRLQARDFGSGRACGP